MQTIPIIVSTPPSITSAPLGVEPAQSPVLIDEMRKLAKVFLDIFLRLAPEQRLLYEVGNTPAVA